MMQRALSLYVALLLLPLVLGLFDCRRSRIACKNGGTCNTATPNECECIDNYWGYACQNPPTFVQCSAAVALDRACENGGTCYTTDTNPLCFCSSLFYGDNCENAAAQIICNAEDIILQMRPAMFDEFTGSVIIERTQIIDSTVVPIAEPCQTATRDVDYYTVTIPLTGGACDDHRIVTINEATGATTYTYFALISWRQGIANVLDEEYTLTCNHAQSGGDVVAGSSITIDGAGSTEPFQEDVIYDGVAVEMAILTTFDPRDPSPAISDVGDQLYIEVSIVNSILVDGQSLYVSTCAVFPCDPGAESCTSTLQMPVITDGCPDYDALSTAGRPFRFNEDVSVVYIPFRMMKFVQSVELYFQCNIQVCESPSTDCVLRTCTSSEVVRRKRETNDVKEQTLSTGMFVLEWDDPYRNRSAINTRKPTSPRSNMVEEPCLENPGFLVVISLQSFLVAISVAVSLAVIVRMRRYDKSCDTAM